MRTIIWQVCRILLVTYCGLRAAYGGAFTQLTTHPLTCRCHFHANMRALSSAGQGHASGAMQYTDEGSDESVRVTPPASDAIRSIKVTNIVCALRHCHNGEGFFF